MKLTKTKSERMSYVRSIIYGPSGIGKTTSLGTLDPDMTLLVCSERGMIPLSHMNFDVAMIESWQDIRELIVELQKPLSIEKKQIKIIAFDSLSAIVEMAKKHIVYVDRKKLITERTQGKSEDPRGIYADLMTQEDYGLLRNRLNGFLGSVTQLPYHIIFTSLEQWTEDKRTGNVYKTPALPGKMALEVPSFFDLVMHMESQEDGSRVWRTTHSPEILAKDASGKLDEFEPSNWQMAIIKMQKGERKGHK